MHPQSGAATGFLQAGHSERSSIPQSGQNAAAASSYSWAYSQSSTGQMDQRWMSSGMR